MACLGEEVSKHGEHILGRPAPGERVECHYCSAVAYMEAGHLSPRLMGEAAGSLSTVMLPSALGKRLTSVLQGCVFVLLLLDMSILPSDHTRKKNTDESMGKSLSVHNRNTLEWPLQATQF